MRAEILTSEKDETNIRNVRAASVSSAGQLQPKDAERGVCVWLTSAFLATLQASRKQEDEKGAKVHGHSVLIWVINSRGEPVGSIAEWPAKRGQSPVWNSAKVLRGVSAIASEGHRLCIEIWEELDGGVRVQLAGPAVLPVHSLPLESTRIEIPRRRCDPGVLYIHALPLAETCVKQIFLVRHGESRWNAAKKAKRYDKMMKEHDHPLNEKGYQQALELQEAIRVAQSLGWSGDNASLSPQAAAARHLIGCEAFWASPLTRALQTALIALEPLLQSSSPPRRLDLKANVREKKNWGGLDSIGRVCGVMCHQRALEELRELDADSGGPSAAEVAKLSKIQVDPLEAQEEWWADGVESDKNLEARLHEFLDQIQHAPQSRIVVVAHSHLFRNIFKRFLHPCFCLRAPDVALRLQTTSIPNGTGEG